MARFMMKKVKYEKLFLINFIMFFLSLFFIINVLNFKIPIFEVISCSYNYDNVCSIFVEGSTLKRLQVNPYVYFKSKKSKVEIVDVYKNYYKNYHKVLIRTNINYKDNEISVSVYKEKKKIIKIFFDCWEE